MSKHNDPLRLVVVCGQPELISRMRNELERAGLAVAISVIETPDEVGQLLKLSACDIVVAEDMPPFNTVAEIVAILQELESDIPCIVIADELTESASAEVRRVGAAAYIAHDHLADLAPTLRRELRVAMLRRAWHGLTPMDSVELPYHTLPGSAFDLLMEIDDDGIYSYASPNFEAILGYRAATLSGAGIFDYIHELDQPEVQRAFAAAYLGTPFNNLEYRFKHSNGTWRWLESTGQTLLLPERDVQLVVVAHDITARKQREQELATLITLAKVINGQSALTPIVQEMSRLLTPLLPFEAVGIALLKDDELQIVAMSENFGNLAGRLSLNRREEPDHPVWEVMRQRTVWIDNARASHPGAIGSLRRAVLGVPLVKEESSFGMLLFFSSDLNSYDENHGRLALTIGEQVAVAVRQTQLLQQARQAEEKYRHLVNDADAIVWEADPEDFRFTFVSPQAEQWLGYPLEQWLENPGFIDQHLHPDDRDGTIAQFRTAATAGHDHQLEFRMLTADGRFLWLRAWLSVELHEGRAHRIRGIMVDISAQKRTEEALLQSNAILQATQDAAADGFFLVDNRGVVVSFNQRFLELWKISPELQAELAATAQTMHYVLSLFQDPDEFINKINYLYDRPDASTRDEIFLKDGRTFERYSAPALLPHGQSYGRVWSFSDISERKNYEEQLTQQAFFDSLTQLPNRALFMNRLTRALSRTKRHHKMTALLFMDLDRFKVVNDSLGHDYGDQLLQKVAQRLLTCLRPGDTAARFGGDEFTILLEEITSINDATHIAQRILDVLQGAFDLQGHEVVTTASIGIVISKDESDRADDLLRNADLAMYYAKHKGKAQYAVFDMNMGSLAVERLQMEIDLRQAIKHHQLRVYYQPLVALASGQIVGVEALLRWDHPTRGLILPMDFIPLAEETGFIIPIGQWVLHEACSQVCALQKEFGWEPPLEVSINLSARQFQQPDLVEKIAKVLRQTGLAAHLLKIEITESVVMEDAQATTLQLEALKQLGVRLAIDDFGIGYSSLSYLRRFQLDALKVDRSFISRMDSDAKDMAIIHAVSTLGHALGLGVTAEGVETAEQLEQVRALSCEVGQGFYFSEPMTYEALRELLLTKPQW